MRTTTFLLLMTFALAACATPPTTPPPTETNTPLPPTTSPTQTPTPTASPMVSPSPTATLPPPPTATPMTYTVVAGDTPIGIATRFGISLDALLAANPGLDPQFLPIGATLIIPRPDQAEAPAPTVVEGVVVDAPVCWPTEAGWWCLVTVHNQAETAVENLTVRVALRNADGEVVAERVTPGPLNRLPAGEVMVLGAFFEHSADSLTAQAELQSATPVADEANRYLPATADFDWDTDAENAVRIRGTINTPDGTRTLWLLGMAFDEQGRPIAFRRVELSPGADGQTAFEFRLFPLQGAAQTVRLLVEARP